MSRSRINPETGDLEKWGPLGWQSHIDGRGRRQRVDPDTGKLEESGTLGWDSVKSFQGKELRLNQKTGEFEQRNLFGWGPAFNQNGKRERVNPETGEFEERNVIGWGPVASQDGKHERVNPETREFEEWSALGWVPSERSQLRRPPPPPLPSRSAGSASYSSPSSADVDISTVSGSSGGGGGSSVESSGCSCGTMVFYLIMLNICGYGSYILMIVFYALFPSCSQSRWHFNEQKPWGWEESQATDPKQTEPHQDPWGFGIPEPLPSFNDQAGSGAKAKPESTRTDAVRPSSPSVPPTYQRVPPTYEFVGGEGYFPDPSYPAAAKKAGVQGRVVLQVDVNVEGVPTDIKVRASSGSALLDDAAIEGVRRWRWPEGETRRYNVPVRFALK